MRWKIVPTVLLGCMGVVSVVASLGMLAIMAYVNLRYGFNVIPQLENFREMAFTVSNVGFILGRLALGLYVIYLARLWWQERYRLAIFLTVASYIVGVAGGMWWENQIRLKRKRIDKKISQPVASSVGLGSNCLVSKA